METTQNSTEVGGCPAATCYATVYRLRLSSPLWPRPAYTKWQSTANFDKALAKAKELGVTAEVESQNAEPRHGASPLSPVSGSV